MTGGTGHRMIIQMPSKRREIATLADLLASIERPWRGEMHVRAIAITVERMRFAVRTLSELLEKSPSTVSTDWLLSLTVVGINRLALRVAPEFRREFAKSSRLLIHHAQLQRDSEPKYAQPGAAEI